MNQLRPYKFMVMPVIQVVDEDDNVVNEISTERPDAVFGIDGLMRYADEFEATLQKKSAELNGVQVVQAS